MQYLKLTIYSLFLFALCCKSEIKQVSSEGEASVSTIIDVESFSKLVNSENQLIDVRTPEEFNEGYILNARNIDYNAADFEKQILTLDKSKPVLVYCKSGGRSAKSAAIFKKNGFIRIYDLEGGFTSWSKAQKPITK